MQKTDFIILLFCAIAAILHGMSGFGFPMLSTAAVAMLYPLSTAVALVLIPCLLLNIYMLRGDATQSIFSSLYGYCKKYWGLIFSALIGSYLGVSLLLILNEGYLKLAMGVLILLYVADQFRQRPLQISASLKNMLIFGLLAGVIGGATNAMAPFLMMYLLSTQHSKTDIVVISNLNFIISKLIQLAVLFPVIQQFNHIQLQVLALICLISVAMVYVGSQIRKNISQAVFKQIVFTLLGLMAIYAIAQGLSIILKQPALMV
ncbi:MULTISPECIES: sulfite exporter TauE/SafE family protein [Acinetobacter]|uniref:sulfite exporter TauE/SafE family protein n=1 Tax=Acinetobacter TaxID=469 RepID=UPI0015B49693|nr:MULTISPECIES: sulfite exporter TauE/SafE family protein [Acinetobacter]MBT0887197.1 TSUP family transporter [Acinetobacter towneri]MDV2454992.1 sulfite exporter TauE/SafE family protein [Acinetobacter towneri]NWJ92604.1 sulfite exporter TauE/SafE family protein [Acinetobacter sp. Swhac1]WOE28915.1 sulfite exporter TauE/SafE family protein [Acinetobacter towneri]